MDDNKEKPPEEETEKEPVQAEMAATEAMSLETDTTTKEGRPSGEPEQESSPVPVEMDVDKNKSDVGQEETGTEAQKVGEGDALGLVEGGNEAQPAETEETMKPDTNDDREKAATEPPEREKEPDEGAAESDAGGKDPVAEDDVPMPPPSSDEEPPQPTADAGNVSESADETDNDQKEKEKKDEGEKPKEAPPLPVISIAAVSTMTEDSGDSDLDTDEEEKEKAKEKETEGDKEAAAKNGTSDDSAPKKPVLKLASFADLGTNGMTAEAATPAAEKLPLCGNCGKRNTAVFAAFVWETMQFCDEECLKNKQNEYSKCAYCHKEVTANQMGKYCVRFGSHIKQFCSNPCLEGHKKSLKLCTYCQKDISGPDGDGFLAPIGDKGQLKDFCEPACLKKYKVLYKMEEAEPPERAPCAVCNKEKEVGCELVRGGGEASTKLCGRPCYSAYVFANGVSALHCDLCDKDFDLKTHPSLSANDHIVYYEGQSKSFCGEACRNVFVLKHRKIVPCAWCKVKKYNFDMVEAWANETDVNTFCSVNCSGLFRTNKGSQPEPTRASASTSTSSTSSSAMPVIQSVSSLAERPGDAASFQQQQHPLPAPMPTPTVREVVKDTVVHQPEPKEVRNKGTLTKPFMQTKGVSCRPHTTTRSCQTDFPQTPTIVPMCVPMYMPMPVQMYNAPYPVPVPIPIPIPVPVFVPTTRNSHRGVLKQIKKVMAKMPSDPFEAELLAMAGSLAGKDGGDISDDSDFVASGDEAEDTGGGKRRPANQVPQADFENDISGGRVVPKPLPLVTPSPAVSPAPGAMRQQQQGGRPQQYPVTGQKRGFSQTRDGDENGEEYNWQRRSTGSRNRSRGSRAPKQVKPDPSTQAALAAVNLPPKERPDAKHHLKFTYGVNAWKHWVVQKNAELEKLRAQGKYMKTFETDILKLRADELSFTLCMFVKEVKKPNGDSYAPDSVFYLTLGIQEYLFENSRIDNIFMDQYYETFTSALHEVVQDFKLPVNELGYFVTRIEEEHLWESRQLGSHSPMVLLNTLIYFNTKYFMLKTLDAHKKLSFSHIMKHWKKQGLPNNAKDKQMLLRYYPPASRAKPGGRDERKCYEQQQNVENPARCPIKFYEFYLARCPESVKTRNDMFYMQPERSCSAESPVWYSGTPLNAHQLDKMLSRFLMVREIQEHMLADAAT